jgi:hypothetical protein
MIALDQWELLPIWELLLPLIYFCAVQNGNPILYILAKMVMALFGSAGNHNVEQE